MGIQELQLWLLIVLALITDRLQIDFTLITDNCNWNLASLSLCHNDDDDKDILFLDRCNADEEEYISEREFDSESEMSAESNSEDENNIQNCTKEKYKIINSWISLKRKNI